MKDKLLIFDMDNTILRSHIDFSHMHRVIADFLREKGLHAYIRRSTSESIMAYEDSAQFDPALAAEMWRLVAEIEDKGMIGAELEPGMPEAFAYLSQFAEIAVLTNNTECNLDAHLGEMGILSYVGCTAGRESVPKLKPYADGMQWVMAHFPHVDSDQVLAIGDAVIDAVAAAGCPIKFVAYNRSRKENWDRSPYPPLLKLTTWNRESCDALLQALCG